MAICDGAIADIDEAVTEYPSQRVASQGCLDSVGPQQSSSDEAISLILVGAKRGGIYA